MPLPSLEDVYVEADKSDEWVKRVALLEAWVVELHGKDDIRFHYAMIGEKQENQT